MRGRGLKLSRAHLLARRVLSPPMRGRGLKLRSRKTARRQVWVAPHAGAWIETADPVTTGGHSDSRPPCGGVD